MSETVTPLEMRQNAATEEPKSTQGLFDLPCGFLEFNAQNQPVLHRDAHVIEMDGEVEDILSSRQVPPHMKPAMMIAKCLRRLGTHTDPGQLAGRILPELLIGDRVYLLLAARRVTLGDNYFFENDCPNPNCLVLNWDLSKGPPPRSRSSYGLNLADLEIKLMPEPMIRSYTRTVEHLGKKYTFTFHPMSGADEARIARFTGDEVSLSMIARLDVWQGERVALRPDGSNIRDLLALVKSINFGVRGLVRDCFSSVEGGIDTTIDLTCPLCNTAFKEELRLDSGFFRPSAASPPSKATSPTSSTASSSPPR